MAKIIFDRVENYEDYVEIKNFVEQSLKFLLLSNEDGLKGKKVIIKPNLLMKKPPEAAVTTHPAVVRAIAEAFVEKEASVFIGESPGGKNTEASFKRALEISGYSEFIKELGIGTVYFDGNYEEVNIGGLLRAKLKVARAAREFDIIVNAVKFKTHGFMGLTAAVKNLFGFVVGTAKAQCHLRFSDPHNFADMLVDLASYIKPTISIVDGIYSMDREGPSSGRVVKTGFLAASDDPFTLDYFLAKHFGIPENRVPTVSQSLKRNLVDFAPETKGSLPSYQNFELPERSRIDTNSRVFSFARNMLTALPYYDKSLCKKCYECLKNCPPQVIKKDESEYPILADEKSCIRCYCCVELCPYGAAKLKYPFLLRVFKNFF